LHFYYFGTCLLFYTHFPQSPTKDYYNLNDTVFDAAVDFKQAISNEYRCINDSYIGSKKQHHTDFTTWIMNGDFRKLFPDSDTTFVYVHDHHADCSAVAYSQLVNFGMLYNGLIY